jgi:parvulin-like peptidyl-prolyl isomerase
MLTLGAAAGLVLASTGLLRGGVGEPAEGVVAQVNATPILAADFERLVAGLESDTRSVADAATRQRVLDRMIDEELLVQRGLELGLAARDRKVRGDLSSAVIRSVVVEADQREVDEDELRAFFEREIAFFTQPGRLRVDQILFRVRDASLQEAAKQRAQRARAALRDGRAFSAVRDEMGDPVISAIPDALLPATKLREYIGPTALAAALKLDVGEVSGPVRSGVGFHLLRAVEREPSRTPDFAAFEAQIRAEWRRRAGDEALRNYLDELRSRATVVTRQDP